MQQNTVSARHWLTAHVESAAIQTAVALGLGQAFRNGQVHSAEIAADVGCDERGLIVLLNALTGLHLVSRHPESRYELLPEVQAAFDPGSATNIESVVLAARQGWSQAGQRHWLAEEALVQAAEAACRHAHPSSVRLINMAWSYTWTAAVLEMAANHVFTWLSERAYPIAELSERLSLSPAEGKHLVAAGLRMGVLAQGNGFIELTPAARDAFGQGITKQYGRWIEQRLGLERAYFWGPLGDLASCIRSGEPASHSSTPGFSGEFRRTFIRVNRPLVAVSFQVARKVLSDLGSEDRPWRALELGTGLSPWGLACAASHHESQVVSVEASAALEDAQRIVAATEFAKQYEWYADDCLELDYGDKQYDLIVLNELCHTLSPNRLVAWLEQVARALIPGGFLLLSDMILDEAQTGPLRHLFSGVKLFVTGGGQLRPPGEYRDLLAQVGLAAGPLYRLPTTDLLLATTSGAHPPMLNRRPSEVLQPPDAMGLK